MGRARILLIEDDAGSAVSLERLLTKEDYEVVVQHRGDEGFEYAKEHAIDVVLSDIRMPGKNGLVLVRELHEAKPRVPIVLMTAFGTTETAIEATKGGAFDYLVKPFDMEQLLEVVDKAVTSARMMSGPVELGTSDESGEAIIGNSRSMQDVYKDIGRIAEQPVTILIRGETGTGKELVARAIYQHSDRVDNAFIAVNCAAIPEHLLESELFGHERGSFTGAVNRRIGRFEQAHEGTLFLDEIGDMSLFTQAKLLRVLQDKSIQRVGGSESIPVDVRIIAATHRDLEAAIGEKEFREDLFYRLANVVIKLPPLRERVEDVTELAKYFLRRFAHEFGLSTVGGIQPDALEWLEQQRWPGNVRQLENVVRQALLAAREFPISVETLETVCKSKASDQTTAAQPLSEVVRGLLGSAKDGKTENVYNQALERLEQELFSQAIRLANGNQAKAARWLNVSRQTMREKLKKFGIYETLNQSDESDDSK